MGHSERRSIFLETNEMVAKKAVLCQKLGLIPMICIGETLAEREAGTTFDVLEKMLAESLTGVSKDAKLTLAYEPVWAIGTGRVASPEQVAEVHLRLATLLNKMDFKGISLLYGGSVNAKNSKELSKVPHVNGFLVGGASLEVESFAALIGECL